MLKHPTLDQLHVLGLHGMAKAFAEIAANGEADGLGHPEWLGLLLDREASLRQDKRFAARLRFAKLRQHRAVLTARFSRSLSAATGSTPTTIWLWSAPLASAKAGWPRLSETRLAATTALSFTSAYRGYSRNSRWRAATGAIRAFCAPSAEPIS